MGKSAGFCGALLLGLAITPAIAAADEPCTAQEEMACQGNATIDLVPLTELAGSDYQGEEGGLFVGGTNEPPEDHACAGQDAAATVQPLDADGNPDPDGRIVLFAVGMSNTTQEFSTFQSEQFNPSTDVSPNVLAVDGAQGGHDARVWAPPNMEAQQTWDDGIARLTEPMFGGEAGVTPEQVQIVWIKQAIAGPQQLGDQEECGDGPCGEFPGHAIVLQNLLDSIIDEAATRFPNLRIVYVSSRTSAYVLFPDDGMGLLNPEPFAFEAAFSTKWLVSDRMGALGPYVTWGPYLWAHSGCNEQGLRWCCDYTGNDFTHPSNTGRSEVGQALMTFLSNDSTAAPWFLADGPAAEPCEPSGTGTDDGGSDDGSGDGADDTTGGDTNGDGGGTTSNGGGTAGDGADGVPDAGGDDAAGDGSTGAADGGADEDAQGCSCSSRASSGGVPAWAWLGLLLARRRRS